MTTATLDLATSNAVATMADPTRALQAAKGAAGDFKTRARSTAQDFEAVFLNTMFQQMFTGIDGEGPFGGGTGAKVWRSFLTDEYSKTIAKSGGVGLADHIYNSLLAHQEAATA
ncbi:MAG TPA: rod-binding protein, partial [Xanthobacteraceae bacterium]|nr:rod-binding protein [Xanthobacteraceae bacterium]